MPSGPMTGHVAMLHGFPPPQAVQVAHLVLYYVLLGNFFILDRNNVSHCLSPATPPLPGRGRLGQGLSTAASLNPGGGRLVPSATTEVQEHSCLSPPVPLCLSVTASTWPERQAHNFTRE